MFELRSKNTAYKKLPTGSFFVCGEGSKATCVALHRDSKGGAIFRQQAESRAGVAEIASDGEQLSVTESLPLRQ